MLTYQDMLNAGDKAAFIRSVITQHQSTELYKTAVDADLYDRQRNVTIMALVDALKKRKRLPANADIKIPCNLFHRVNRQLVSYLLGNGATFSRKEKRSVDGQLVTVDLTREALGKKFDGDLYRWGYKARIHGVAFAYVTPERLYVYPVTNFAPIYDEDTGAMMAGVRFWQLDTNKPMIAELYTDQGIDTYKSPRGGGALELEDHQPYQVRVTSTEARGVIGIDSVNSGGLPVVQMYGSDLHQSTLVGMRARVDSIDLVQTGFGRDVRDVSKIYWLIANHGGMTDADLDKFLDDIATRHIAKINDSTAFTGDTLRNSLTPYTQDVPTEGNMAFLNYSRAALMEDAGALDVHSISAGSTNDHIDAAYQPLDDEADDFENQVIEAVQQVLKIRGIDDTPTFKRNRIANTREQIQAVMLEANVLGRRKTLEKLPNVTTDEVDEILADDYAEGLQRLTDEQ